MVTTAMMFAIACVAIELFFVTQYEKFETLLIKHEKLGIFWSIALSWIMGEVFGAQGVIVLMSAMFSTVITTIIYKCHLLKYIKMAKNGELSNKLAPVRQTIKDVATFFKFIVRIITAPVRFCRWIKTSVNTGVSTVKSHIPHRSAA